MLKLLATARAMLASKRAAAAVVVALSTPVLLGAAGFGVEAGLLEAKRAQLQNAADAAATAGRETLNPVLPTPQDRAIQNAVQYGNTNLSSSTHPNDVEFLWLNLTPQGGREVQAPIVDGFYSGFANAVRVTTRVTQPLIFGKLLGIPAINLSRQSMAYKCSNNIEPESNVPGEITDPTEPAMYSSWASLDHPDPHTSYYIKGDNGHRVPVFKFYSPYDYEVSWTARFDDGAQLQVETYCRGWTLVMGGVFDLDTQPPFGHATVQRGLIKPNGLIDTFDADPDPKDKVAFADTTFYDNNVFELPQAELPPNTMLKSTPFPAFVYPYYQPWYSTGQPTPGRQSIIVPSA